jgi:hypothetical protein
LVIIVVVVVVVESFTAVVLERRGKEKGILMAVILFHLAVNGFAQAESNEY